MEWRREMAPCLRTAHSVYHPGTVVVHLWTVNVSYFELNPPHWYIKWLTQPSCESVALFSHALIREISISAQVQVQTTVACLDTVSSTSLGHTCAHKPHSNYCHWLRRVIQALHPLMLPPSYLLQMELEFCLLTTELIGF